MWRMQVCTSGRVRKNLDNHSSASGFRSWDPNRVLATYRESLALEK